MKYLEEIGRERKDREYKIMAISGLKISSKLAVRMLKSGIFRTEECDMNYYMRMMIKKYMEIYIKKYIATYSHPRSGKRGGELYYGVDDLGIVHGIPYEGELREKEIRRYMEESYIKNVRMIGKDKRQYIEYIKRAKIEIKRLEVEEGEIKRMMEEKTPYEEYKEKTERYSKIIRDYKEYKNKWEKMNKRYAMKLNMMLNKEETKREIINLIKERGSEKGSYYRRSVYAICECGDYYKLMTEIKT